MILRVLCGIFLIILNIFKEKNNNEKENNIKR